MSDYVKRDKEKGIGRCPRCGMSYDYIFSGIKSICYKWWVTILCGKFSKDQPGCGFKKRGRTYQSAKENWNNEYTKRRSQK